MLNPETLKILDPACGSGHILVEAYDILKAIYLDCGYRQRDIPKLILENNLYGLDIDDRAAQLAGFALMMKAREDDRRIFSRDIKLNVLAIQEIRGEGLGASDELWVGNYLLPELLEALDLEGRRQVGENLDLFEVRGEGEKLSPTPSPLIPILKLFERAKTLGSLIQVPHEQTEYLRSLTVRLRELAEHGNSVQKPAATALLPYVQQAWVLAQHYDAVVANPPYMGGKGMNAALKDFAKKEFSESKSDLFAMFMERFLGVRDQGLGMREKQSFSNPSRLNPNSYIAMVTMQSWMFLSSYEKFREKLLEDKTISSMIHLGARAFPEISGEVVQTTAFVFHQQKLNGYKPVFFRLIEGNSEQKETALRLNQNRFDKTIQDDFKKIPGSPIAYWVSDKIRDIFKSEKIMDTLISGGRCKTHNDDVFVRLFWELTCNSIHDKWKFYEKGGSFRKWYGNKLHVVDWSEQAIDEYASHGGLTKQEFWQREGITWSDITSSANSFRLKTYDSEYSSVSPCLFSKENNKNFSFQILGFLNSSLSFNLIKIVNPTLHANPGDIAKLPALQSKNIESVKQAIFIAKTDWNNYETSWNFTENPLIRQLKSEECLVASDENKKLTPNPLPLATCFTQWQTQNRAAILEMQRLEEENNRLFIEAYGLQDELTPEVPEDQITLTRADREKDTQRLISYAIGCMMGRYRLDRPGLIYAHSGNQNFWEIYEQGGLRARDEGLGASEENPHPSSLTPTPYNQGVNDEQRASSKELPRPDRVAEINGIGGESLSNDQSFSNRGTLWSEQSDTAGSRVNSIEYSGRSCTEKPSGISEFSIDSSRFESGSRNANIDSRATELCNRKSGTGNYDATRRVSKNAEYSSQPTKLTPSSLNPNPFLPEEDGILPLTDQEWFKDDAANRFRDFIDAAFPNPSSLTPDPLEKNLEFVAESLTLSSFKPKKGETSLDTVRRYLCSQFYKDHLQTYKKRPIYWLFSSGKQKAFECLVYLHRYNESTLARMRTEYVTPLLGKYNAYIEQLNKQIADAASTAEANRLKKEQQALEKKQTELRQFDDKLKHYADMRIKLDLDDGVKVNYGKFGDLLAEVKAVTGGSGE